MKRLWNGTRALLVVSVMVLLNCPAWGQSEQRSFSPRGRKAAPAAPSSLASDQRTKKIGAPQVIEIPLPEPPPLPSPSWQENVREQHSQSELSAVPSSTTLFSRPGYLGVLYATAEDGPAGVNVLGIIAGSPAERAGFSPASSPFSPTRTEQVLQVVTILLALSPGWPLVIPLMIAQDKHHRRSPRGDLIVVVDGQPVRDAQEFNAVMRHFGPGDTVTFLVQRGTTQMSLSAQLEAEP